MPLKDYIQGCAIDPDSSNRLFINAFTIPVLIMQPRTLEYSMEAACLKDHREILSSFLLRDWPTRALHELPCPPSFDRVARFLARLCDDIETSNVPRQCLHTPTASWPKHSREASSHHSNGVWPQSGWKGCRKLVLLGAIIARRTCSGTFGSK